MIIKEREYDTCPDCGKRELIKDEVYGCDWCKSEMHNTLEVTVFQENGEAKRHQLCSWECVFEILPSLKSDYFISLPELIFDEEIVDQSAADFFRHLDK